MKPILNQVPAPGIVIDDKYTIVDCVGEGGMGTVFRAVETELNREVAIKILHPGLVTDEEQRTRFEREGRILSALAHPNILTFYRFGLWDKQRPYIVMEYLHGRPLRQVLDEEELELKDCVDIGVQICNALEYAHNHDVIHRDIKPGNIFLVPSSEGRTVKVVDFGLAKASGMLLQQHLTQTGELIGSVFYMSPEQCMGQRADSRADIYSLGCVIYEMCFGSPPFEADNPIGLMHKHASEQPSMRQEFSKIKGADKSQISALNAVLQKCLAKRTEQRYQTMAELRDDLLLVQGGVVEAPLAPMDLKVPSRRKPIALGVGAATAVALCLGGALLVKQSEPSGEVVEPLVPKKLSSISTKLNTGLTGNMAGPVASMQKLPRGKRQFELCETLIKNVENGADIDEETAQALYLKLRELGPEFERAEDYETHVKKAIEYAERKGFGAEWKGRLHSWLAEHFWQRNNSIAAEIQAREALKYLGLSKAAPYKDAIALVVLCKALRLQSQSFEDPMLLSRTLAGLKHQHIDSSFVQLAPELAYVYLKRSPEKEPALWQENLEFISTSTPEINTDSMKGWAAALQSADRHALILPRLKEWVNRCKRSMAPVDAAECELQAGIIMLNLHDYVEAELLIDKAYESLCSLGLSENALQLALSRGALAKIMRGKLPEARRMIDLLCQSEADLQNLQDVCIACLMHKLYPESEKLLDAIDDALISSRRNGADVMFIYERYIRHLPESKKHRALELWDRCKRVVQETASNDSQLVRQRIEVERAKQMKMTGDYHEAITLIEKAIPFIDHKFPHEVDIAYITLAELNFRLGQPGDHFAALAIERARKRDNYLEVIHTYRTAAEMYKHCGYTAKAEQCLLDNINALNKWQEAAMGQRLHLAAFYNTLGRPKDTIKLLEGHFAQLDCPADWRLDTCRLWIQTQTCRAQALLVMGDATGALKFAQMAEAGLETHPQVDAQYLLADLVGCFLCVPNPNLKHIALLLEKSEKLSRDMGPRQLYIAHRAALLLGQGKREESLRCASSCIELCEFRRTDQTDQALNFCETVCKTLGEEALVRRCQQLRSRPK